MRRSAIRKIYGGALCFGSNVNKAVEALFPIVIAPLNAIVGSFNYASEDQLICADVNAAG